MANKAAFLRVGLLLIACVAAAVGLVLFLGQGRISNGVAYEAYFRESVQGLDVGAPVKFRGVTLGQVTQIGLVAAEYRASEHIDVNLPEARLVVVRWIADPRRLGPVLQENNLAELGLRARLASQGITGLAYIELDFVDPARFPAEKVPWTPRDIHIPSMPSTITQVQDAAQALADKLSKIDIARLADSVQAVLNDVHGQLTTGDAKTTLVEIAAMAKALHQGVDAADLPGLAADLRGTVADLKGTLNSKDTHSLIAATTQAADKLATAAARLPALISALETTVRRADASTGDLQADIAPVLRDARAAAANLRETSETLRRYPASVLLGAPPPNEQGGRR